MRALWLTLAFLALTALSAAPARADVKQGGHDQPAAKADHGGHGGDAPWKKVLDLRWDLGLWSLIIFLALLAVLKKLAWGPMLEGLHKREASIRGAIEEAQKSRAESQKLRDQFQQELNQASQKVHALMEEARRDAEQLKERMTAEAKAEIQTERDRLRREIDTAKDQALHDIWHQSVQLATLVSAKTIRRELSSDDHRRLIDEAISELKQAANGQPRQLAGAR